MGLIGPFADLPENLPTNEQAKFELDPSGYVRVRTSATGTFSWSGLSTAMLTTSIQLGDTAQALPASALSGRNSLVIFNTSSTDSIFIGGSSVTADTPVSFPDYTWGQEIPPRSFWNVDLAGAIVVYGRCQTGKTVIVKITEYA